MVRRLAVGLFLLLCVAVPGSLQGCGPQLPEGVIAQVGGAYISQNQLDELLATYAVTGVAPDQEGQPEQYKLFRQKCAEYLVILQVLYQKALEFNVTVTSVDTDERLAQVRQMFLGNEAAFAAALASQGMTLDQLTQSIRETIWFEKMKEAVTAQAAVRDDEVRAYYQEHVDDYTEQESRYVRHILISPFLDAAGNTLTETPTQSDWYAAESEAAKVRSEVQNGTDFVTEVERYSDDPASNTAGGDLGWITRGQTAPAFERAVFSLQIGGLSLPVRTPSGYHVIELRDIKPAQQLRYEAVKEQIRSALLTQRKKETWEQWLTEMQTELGVSYRRGYAPPGAVQGAPQTSTTGAGWTGETTTGGTVAGETTTSTSAQ